MPAYLINDAGGLVPRIGGAASPGRGIRPSRQCRSRELSLQGGTTERQHQSVTTFDVDIGRPETPLVQGGVMTVSHKWTSRIHNQAGITMVVGD